MDVRLNIEFDIFICLAWSSWISAVLGVKSRSIPYSLIFYDYVLVLFVLCVCTICLFPYGSDDEFLLSWVLSHEAFHIELIYVLLNGSSDLVYVLGREKLIQILLFCTNEGSRA